MTVRKSPQSGHKHRTIDTTRTSATSASERTRSNCVRLSISQPFSGTTWRLTIPYMFSWVSPFLFTCLTPQPQFLDVQIVPASRPASAPPHAGRGDFPSPFPRERDCPPKPRRRRVRVRVRVVRHCYGFERLVDNPGYDALKTQYVCDAVLKSAKSRRREKVSVYGA